MAQTLSKVKDRERFIRMYGDDELISQTISKMLDYKLQQINEEIKKIDRDLKKFERTYKKESSVFFKRFKEGKMGDDLDFVEWSSLYQMRERLHKRKTELEGMK